MRKSKKDRQWPNEKGQKDKQRSTKHYTENYRSSNTNPTKTGVKRRCSGRVSSFSSTSGTRRVNLVTNPVISHISLAHHYIRLYISNIENGKINT